MSAEQDYYDEDTIRSLYVEILAKKDPKKEYLRYSPNVMWDGGVDTYGKRYKSVWPKVTKFFRSHNWGLREIKDYISYAINIGISHPNKLTDLKIVDKFKNHTQNIVPTIWNKIESEFIEFQRSVKYWVRVLRCAQLKAARITLSDKTILLSPPFRYFMAKAFELNDIAESFRNEAENMDPTIFKIYEQALTINKPNFMDGSCNIPPN